MAKEVKTYTLRGASQYLATKGVDVSELRMRTLVNQHEIFVNGGAYKGLTREDSAVQQWFVKQDALDAYAKAAAAGTVKTSTGAKAYKLNLNAEQLEQARQWAKANGIAEPVRANKTYTKKGKPATNGAIGSDIAQELTDDDEDEGVDGLFADETEEVEA